MAEASVATVKDERIALGQKPPVMLNVEGATNIERYEVDASGLSNTSITFPTITLPETNRVLDPNIRIRYTGTITFTLRDLSAEVNNIYVPTRYDTTFRSFPLNMCVQQYRANLNGANISGRPWQWLTPRMQYWSREKLMRSYCNSCPCDKALISHERFFHQGGYVLGDYNRDFVDSTLLSRGNRTRPFPGFIYNNEHPGIQWVQKLKGNGTLDMNFSFEEPVMLSPFNSNILKPYNVPFTNITSLDLQVFFNDINNMLLNTDDNVLDWRINLTGAWLVYYVASLPTGIATPPSQIVPYWDHTVYTSRVPNGPIPNGTQFECTSGQYQMTQVPQAIWIYICPSGSRTRQVRYNYNVHKTPADAYYTPSHNLFATIHRIKIQLGNNTQLLYNMNAPDLYRTCLANGLEDTSLTSFTNPITLVDIFETTPGSPPIDVNRVVPFHSRQGSCIRLIPGADIVLPDKKLIPGSAIDGMTFKVDVEATWNGSPGYPGGGVRLENYDELELTIMLDFCGTLVMERGTARIDLAPVKAASRSMLYGGNLVSDSAEPTVGMAGTEVGAGIWDSIKTRLQKWFPNKGVTKMIDTVAPFLPGVGSTIAKGVARVTDHLGLGDYEGGRLMDTDEDFYETPTKRSR